MTHSIPAQSTHTNADNAPVSFKIQAGSPKPDISNSGNQLTKMIVKVADYRREYDRMFTLVNDSYHACVGKQELVFFKESLINRFSRLSIIDCKRASAYDKKQYQAAVVAAKKCLLKVDNCIEDICDVDDICGVDDFNYSEYDWRAEGWGRIMKNTQKLQCLVDDVLDNAITENYQASFILIKETLSEYDKEIDFELFYFTHKKLDAENFINCLTREVGNIKFKDWLNKRVEQVFAD